MQLKEKQVKKKPRFISRRKGNETRQEEGKTKKWGKKDQSQNKKAKNKDRT